MPEFLITVALSGGWALLLFVASNLYMVLAANASLALIPSVRKIRALLRTVRGNAVVLHCRKGVVSVTGYDAATDSDVDRPIYHSSYPCVSFLRWTRGSRSVDFFIRRATMDIVFRVGLAVGFLLPALTVAIWLALVVHWTWWYLFVAMIAHQIVVGVVKRFVYIKSFGMFAVLVGMLVLHRGNWLEFPWTVGVSIISLWTIASFGVAWWVAQDD